MMTHTLHSIETGTLVSVIVPVYNTEKYLRRCIDSILSQSYRTIEIILVNDGSTDRSEIICREYVELDPRVFLVYKKNGGLVSARKAGIRASHGDYVVWVDSDDWIEDDYIEKMMEFRNTFSADMVVCDLFRDDGAASTKIRSGVGYGAYRPKDIVIKLIYDGTFFQHGIQPFLPSKLIKKSLIEELFMVVDERISTGEDAAISYEAIINCEHIFISEYCGYHYVNRIQSMSKTKSRNELERCSLFFRYIDRRLARYELYPVLHSQLNAYFKYILLIRCMGFFDKDEQIVLSPFGGVHREDKLAIYGAGVFGQEIYRYLTVEKSIFPTFWFDNQCDFYANNGMDVVSPDKLKEYAKSIDIILIAVTSKRIAEEIMGVITKENNCAEKVRWLSDEFLAGCERNFT